MTPQLVSFLMGLLTETVRKYWQAHFSVETPRRAVAQAQSCGKWFLRPQVSPSKCAIMCWKLVKSGSVPRGGLPLTPPPCKLSINGTAWSDLSTWPSDVLALRKPLSAGSVCVCVCKCVCLSVLGVSSTIHQLWMCRRTSWQ